jgi:hypothetical protein
MKTKNKTKQKAGKFFFMSTSFFNKFFQPRLCGNPDHPSKKWFWGTLYPSLALQTFLFSKPKIYHRGHDSANLGEKSIFPGFRAYQSLGDQMLTGWEAYEPQASIARQ